GPAGRAAAGSSAAHGPPGPHRPRPLTSRAARSTGLGPDGANAIQTGSVSLVAIEMELVGIELERPPNIPCLVLRETEGKGRILPIFIGGVEATAIAFALEEVETPRPMTHDLMKDLLDEIGVEMERIVVTDMRESTFYAEIVFRVAGEVHTVSSRPSD